MIYVSDELITENQNKHFNFNDFFKNGDVLRKCKKKNIVEPYKPNGACAFYAGYLRLQTQLRMCITYCCNTALIAARTRLAVTSYYITNLLNFIYKWLVLNKIIQPHPFPQSVTHTNVIISYLFKINPAIMQNMTAMSSQYDCFQNNIAKT